MPSSKVAVVMRTKNRPLLLARALDSVCSQTYRDWILVVVNDGGDPEPVERLVRERATSADDRIVVVHHDRSLGMEAASNRGIRAVTSDYLLIHDDDDSLHPQFLEKTIQFLDSPFGSRFAGVAVRAVKVLEEIRGDVIVTLHREPYRPDIKTVGLAEMAVSNPVPPISFLYRRSVHDAVGYYDESLPVLGDWEFYLRVLERFDIYYLDEELAYYHHRYLKTGTYSNTVVGQTDLHRLYDTLVRNRRLREDLAKGTFGLGALLAIASLHASAADAKKALTEEAKRSVVRQLRHNRVRRVAVYGTGEFADDLYRLLAHNGVETGVFVDSDARLHGKMFHGVEVVPLEEAARRGFRDFAVASFSYADDIAATIALAFEQWNLPVRIFCP